MKSAKTLSALLRVELKSASVADMLTVINNSNFVLKNVTQKDVLTVCATINRVDYQPIKLLLTKRGETIKIIKKHGLLWLVDSVKKRPVLLVGIAMLIFLSLYLPTRVLFVNVEGNHTVPTKQIIEAAERTGISFGASRQCVRSEQIKNALLTELPQLQWVGVNTYGCVAVISVEERTIDSKINTDTGVSSVIASCDGLIKEITVTRGNALCKIGQAVVAGQVLVSGYTDCGITIKATNAEAEIYADTSHTLDGITPAYYDVRTQIERSEERFYLIFGKKLIKLFKDSGISTASCVKMYEENYIVLPGGFQLPIAIVTERLYSYGSQVNDVDDISSFGWMKKQSDKYILSHMNAGKILSSNATFTQWNGTIFLSGEYACYEMIGQIYNEEIYKNNE